MIKKTTTIEGNKKLATQPTVSLKVPEFLYIATANARCPKAEVYIQPGDHVNRYQVIGRRHAKFFDQPIHATCSGTYIGLEKHYHRSGKRTDFRKIQNDFQDTVDPSVGKERTDEEVLKLTRKDRVEILKEKASVGLGGSSFPTYVKFDTDKKIDTILIDAIECEPYISADHRIALEDQEIVVKGIKLVRQAFNCHKARICIKKDYKDLEALYNSYLERCPNDGISVKKVGNFYPQGWEVARIKSATGITVEQGHLPSEYGIRNFNISTIIGIYQAIKYNLPVTERIISVTGDGIKHPTNFKVRVGTPLKYVIEACGGYTEGDKKTLILGGPRMGESLPSDDAIITKTVTSVLVFDHKDVKPSPCIRCGSCVRSCPVGLQPVTIRNTRNTRPVDREKIKLLNPQNCIGCGLCSYSCTSHIDVKSYVARAKVIARLK